MLCKFIEALEAHVGNVDVADRAARLLGDVILVVLHPALVVQGGLVAGRKHRDVASALVDGLRVHPEDNLLADLVDERGEMFVRSRTGLPSPARM